MIISDVLTKVEGSDTEEIRALYAQLSESGIQPDDASIESAIRDRNTVVIVLREDTTIIGMGTVVLVRVMSGVKARLEDIVVDEGYRGQGLGERITNELIETARSYKVSVIELTSKPERVAANALYQKVGFEKKDTNTYVLRV
ncbi:MAG: GNAT family N-acetyltransferase [Candidatus Spechtbacterales bacterium]